MAIPYCNVPDNEEEDDGEVDTGEKEDEEDGKKMRPERVTISRTRVAGGTPHRTVRSLDTNALGEILQKYKRQIIKYSQTCL